MCVFRSMFNQLRLYEIRAVRDGGRKIQLSKAIQAIQYHLTNINQVILVPKELHQVLWGVGGQANNPRL